MLAVLVKNHENRHMFFKNFKFTLIWSQGLIFFDSSKRNMQTEIVQHACVSCAGKDFNLDLVLSSSILVKYHKRLKWKCIILYLTGSDGFPQIQRNTVKMLIIWSYFFKYQLAILIRDLIHIWISLFWKNKGCFVCSGKKSLMILILYFIKEESGKFF